MKFDNPYQAADERLGRVGRIISGSKIPQPGQKVVWNANVCVKSAGKVWFGDIDLNNPATRTHLIDLATDLGEPVYVLREHDARFKNEKAPLYDEAVEVFQL